MRGEGARGARSAGTRRHEVRTAHVGPPDHVGRRYVHDVERGVVDDLVREIAPERDAGEGKTAAHCARAAPRALVRLQVEYDAALAVFGLLRGRFRVLLALLDEAIVMRWTDRATCFAQASGEPRVK